MIEEYLKNIKTQFESYKEVADKTIAQLTEKDLYWRYNEESNDIACIIMHLSENMLSRWTDFLKVMEKKNGEIEKVNLLIKI